MGVAVPGILAALLLPGLALSASFTPLGVLPDGVGSRARGVSADGAVVVGQAFGDGVEAFRWSGGAMTGLGFLPGGFRSSARGVSADGAVVVGSSDKPASGDEAFRLTGGVMTGLGTLPGDAISYATSVSADGAVVVGGSYRVGASSNESSGQAFRWAGGVMAGIGVLPGDTDAYANGVSADGTVVVGASLDELGNSLGFRWTQAGGMQGLGVLQDATQSNALGVSADGTVVVGGSGDTAGNDEAFRWVGGVITGLGFLPGDFRSYAAAVSADGAVVVGESTGELGSQAFVWTQPTGLEQLFDLLVANGATGLEGWSLTTARGISPDGQWVVGSGTNPAGQEEAFLANIGPDSDGDGTWDSLDNCTQVANPGQCDSDGDGYGNRCDGDLNNNGATNAQDVTLIRQQLGLPSVAPTYNKADINCNGAVNAQDVTLFRQLLGKPPGPSGLVP